MELVIDLHVHSKYSRAVSPAMEIPEMSKWAGIKGIDVLGTGDFTHPLWLSHLKENLEEEGHGVYKQKIQNSKFKIQNCNSKFKIDKEINFLLTSEISSIYKEKGKTRKVHSLIIAPSFETVEKINKELVNHGFNIKSDGRPIIGFSAKNLLELVLGVDKECLLIPCHIWTPHFSMFGSVSGFDSIEECFGDLSKYIYGIETGLSSDPLMNWQIPELDNRTILSFSDAHSAEKLGREATVLITQNSNLKTQNHNSKLKAFSYEDIVSAIKNDNRGVSAIGYTIEFYPEEGKYHYSGHRNCHIRFTPEESIKYGKTCPVCGKKLTEGVFERVGQLGKLGRVEEEFFLDEKGVKWIRGKKGEKGGRTPFVKLVPLKEIIAESLGVGDSSKKVKEVYEKMIEEFGSELEILMRTGLDNVEKLFNQEIAEGINKMRAGDIFISPGFDGQFGKVKIWKKESDKDELVFSGRQEGLF